MTRVLVVNHAVELGGAERTLVELLARRSPELTVTLAVPEEGALSERVRALGIRVEMAGPGNAALSFRRSESKASPLKLAATAAGLGAGLTKLVQLARGHDLVVTNSTKAHLYGSLAARMALRPVAWRLHDVIDAETFSPPVRKLYLGAARALPARIVAVSQAVATPLQQAGAGPVLVRPNGVSLRRIVDPEATRKRLRQELEIPETAPFVVCIGRLTPQKGVEVLLEALSAHPHVHAAIVGDALFSSADYEKKLKSRAASLGSRVVFIGSREDIPELLVAADLLVHPAVQPDSLPTVILEAIASGRPVVATTAGGAKEILEGEAGGLLVPPGDALALGDAIGQVLGSFELSRRLSERARLRSTDFTADRAYAEVWAALLG